MKKIPFVFALLLLICRFASAQDIGESTTIKKVERAAVPAAVLAAFERDFPGGKTIDYRLIPVKLYQSQWVVTSTMENEDLKGQKADYYDIATKGDNFTSHAIYKSDGKLMKFSEKITDKELPAPILESIRTGSYQNWTIVGDKEVIKTASKKPDYYRVKLKKDHHHEYLYFDLAGKPLPRKAVKSKV